jgi:circadian clock protein KaiB
MDGIEMASTPIERQDAEPEYRFTLYVAGDNDMSRRAEANLRGIIEGCIPRRYALDVIDVVADPKRAIQDRVTITPMVAKFCPAPLRKVIGDFTDRQKVLIGLGIDAANCLDKSQERLK